MNVWKLPQKAFSILIQRLRTQGIRTTFLWAYVRGTGKLTGIPQLHFSQITPEIFVGGQFGRQGKILLEQAGITSSVNLRIEYDDAAHGLALAHYCYLPTVDDEAPTIEQLQQGVAFIEQSIAAGRKVYIHCAGGVGRAPTMCIAYLLSRGMDLDQSLTLIQTTRPFIQLSAVQTEQLQRFASTIQNGR